MPNRLRHMKLGFRTSVITLFVSIVLVVGLSLVYLSFARVTSIIRSAAGTFIDKVAESAAGRIDAQFKDVRDCVEVLTSLPSVREARVDNPAINVITAMLRNNNQLFNLYMGYDDGTFLEVDVIDRAGRAFRDKLAPPADAVYRQFVIRKTGEDGERAAKVVFLSQTLAPIAERSVPVDYDPRERPWYRDASHPDAGISRTPISSSRVANRDTPFVFRSGKDGPA
jgi:adenylate cyclase